ncbi:hypothetical protein BDV11DRAFT_190762 [Aspergillus similis]
MSAHGPPAVPSRNALRVLRNLALAGSTVGSFCTVAAITYDVHRRVSVAERIIENKRALQTSAPRYDATSAARRISRMMEAAEAGEFMGLEAWKESEKKYKNTPYPTTGYDGNGSPGESPGSYTTDGANSPVTVGSMAGTAAKSEEVTELVTELGWKLNRLRHGARTDIPPSKPLPPSLKPKYVVRQLDPDADIATIDARLDLPSGSQLTLDERIERLTERGQYIDAAQIFLDEHPASSGGISIHRRQIVEQLFYLNCRQENVFIARSLFERLEEVDRVSHTMWKILIVALAKKGCIESATTVFLRYKDSYSIPGILLDVVLRCLIESRRLQTAKQVLFQHLHLDRDCGLCGVYLTGLWKKARSIELLNGQFTKLLIMLRRLDKKPTHKLISPMLQAYVDFGRFADAETLLHEMMVTYQVPLNVRMKGILVYAKALQCDWTAVDEGFEEMHNLGLTSPKADFLKIFHRIFLEYWPSHTAVEIRDFLYRYIDKFDIVPDQVLWGHILEAVVERGDMAMLSEFTNLARERGWKINLDQNAVLDVLRKRQSALGDSPVGFWQMLHAARADNMRATASQQLLGHDQRTNWRQSNHTVEQAYFADGWYERTVHELTGPSRSIDDYQNLQTQMIYYIHAGKMAEALQCFQDARVSGFELKPQEVELALIATLLSQGLGAAQALVEVEVEWIEWLPIFFRQIKDMDPSAESEFIQLAIFRFYRIRWMRRSMMVTHNITAATSGRLIASNKPEMAIDLLVSVYRSKYGRLKAFDAVCMKMFLRAFAATENLRGIRWCILTALSRDSALSRDFAVEADRVLGVLRRESVGISMNLQKAKLRADQLKTLTYLGEVLHKKFEGCFKPGVWNVNYGLKKAKRRELKTPSANIWNLDHNKKKQAQSKIQGIVNSWDEEYELERLLDCIDNDQKSILARWNEVTCRRQELELEQIDGVTV